MKKEALSRDYFAGIGWPLKCLLNFGMNIFRNLAQITLLTLLVLLGYSACKQPDIRLVNKVKTFSPKWAQLNDKFSRLDRNLDIAEDRFAKDFAEIEGMFGEIEGKLKGKEYRGMLVDYEKIVTDLDTIRNIYVENKSVYSVVVQEFNSFEQQVMNVEIESDEGKVKLKEYKAIHKEIEAETDSLKLVLEGSFSQHNSILRGLCEMMGVFQNFDIRYQ